MSRRSKDYQVVIPIDQLNERTLKACCTQAVANSSGFAEILIKVPGSFEGTDGEIEPPNDGRFIEYGLAFFKNPEHGDKITAIEIVDEDRILAYLYGELSDEQMQGLIPGYPVLGSYSDDQMDAANRGWYMIKNGETKVDAANGPGFLPSEMYLRIRAQKAAGSSVMADTLYVNFKWSKWG